MMQGITTLIDPLAELLLRLRTVSGAQWTLRLAGSGAMLLALWGTLPGGLFAHFPSSLLTVAVGALVIVQAFRPDTEAGPLAPLLLLGALVLQPDLSFPRAAAIGLSLLLAQGAFALAATAPAHGKFERSAWRLAASGMLVVLAVSAVAGLLVVGLSGVRLGSWLLVLGALATVGLMVLVLPRPR